MADLHFPRTNFVLQPNTCFQVALLLHLVLPSSPESPAHPSAGEPPAPRCPAQTLPSSFSCWELALSSLYSLRLIHFLLRTWESHIPPYTLAVYTMMSWKKRFLYSSVYKGINFCLSNCCRKKNGKAIPYLPQRQIYLPPESK